MTILFAFQLALLDECILRLHMFVCQYTNICGYIHMYMSVCICMDMYTHSCICVTDLEYAFMNIHNSIVRNIKTHVDPSCECD